MTEKRYQLRQEQLDYPIVNFCCDLVDTENNDKVICSFDNDIGTSKMVDLLNEKEERINELEKDLNDALNRIEERSIDVQLLKEENGNLKKENELKGDFRNFINEDIVRIKKENEQLKEALKELKEIGDYQEMRIQELCDMNSLIEDEIDKKIAVLTDAKIKSFHNGDEELLGKIKFSIQVLRELKEVILE